VGGRSRTAGPTGTSGAAAAAPARTGPGGHRLSPACEIVDGVEVLEELIAELGGDPGYVSPAARATEKAGSALLESTFLLGDPWTS
jgi:hypothetical protein